MCSSMITRDVAILYQSADQVLATTWLVFSAVRIEVHIPRRCHDAIAYRNGHKQAEINSASLMLTN